jgi:hypothetical protein
MSASHLHNSTSALPECLSTKWVDMKSAVFGWFSLSQYEHTIHGPRHKATLSSGSLIYGPSSSLSMPPWERRHAVANIPRWGRNAELATETDFQVWEHAHNVNHDHAQHHLLQWDCIPQEVEFT